MDEDHPKEDDPAFAVMAAALEDVVHLVVAVPTAAPPAGAEIARGVDEYVRVIGPDPFYAVGVWYDGFSRTTHDQVRDILGQADVDPAVAKPA